ncbi:cyclic GMP-AMP phosphodiesterase SMPDL3A [Nomia melanderi]|uniref:cyclic GMP-AMP phosphodiesterase SMPDL3A n=1 Tax=Nomia melanderi TaxID=2448451 RepID=UPI0013047702|nr:acid sphingomyelinase-like phosphodiesterase 3a isoform X2 [Nomia melanderi]XP_031829472.1 acid sphingomyelinase-like phosphodiesterase 3a isoform X2 [Nomia melanderi]XP_031829473.1 acid sphingomyelinase-like phosphodiesterase 3a isoform X2 [Nomia melanderi]
MMIRDYLMILSWLCAVQGKIGYFWHITDIHYDPKYSTQGNAASMCWDKRNSGDSGRIRLDRRLAGEFGDYSCDSPWALIESAARAMRSQRGEGIEFVLWTGDALTRTASMSAELRLQCLRNLTDLLSRTFKEQFVFPALGHEDLGVSFSQLAALWQQWLPQEALDTFQTAGYYTIEQRSEKYRIIFLNTNLWLHIADNHRTAASTIDNTEDPFGQWSWFQSTLDTARRKKETVYIVGHTPPGMDERESGAAAYSEQHNNKYQQTVRLYSDIIRGQFFGHWHSDTFRVVYSDTGPPVSWIMMAPSISPNTPGGPNNPGLRLYKFETNTGQVLDYTQYYLDLPEANSIGKANWLVGYSLLEHYGLQEITPISLHDLADRLTQANDNAFVRYYAANTVFLPREVEQVWGCGGPLNGFCALHHYCTVTRMNPESYKECYTLNAFALASRGPPTATLHVTLHLLVLLICCAWLSRYR